MSGNSIRAHLTPDIVANDVMLRASKHAGSFLLVEGDTDSALFRSFVDECECSIVVCGGRANLVGALVVLLGRGLERALGYADKDYCLPSDVQACGGSVVFTDYNDIEMQMLASLAFDKLIGEFGSSDKIGQLTRDGISGLREIVFEEAKKAGALRRASVEKGWGLTFRGANIELTRKSRGTFNFQKYVESVLKNSNWPVDVNVITANSAIESICSERSAEDLCNGHDCLKIIGLMLHKRIGSCDNFKSAEGARDLEKVLRLAYEFEYFCQTKGWQKIRQWETDTGCKVLRN